MNYWVTKIIFYAIFGPQKIIFEEMLNYWVTLIQNVFRTVFIYWATKNRKIAYFGLKTAILEHFLQKITFFKTLSLFMLN
jgi:hypothetical protein